MKRTIMGSILLPWVLFFGFAVVVVSPVFLAWCNSSAGFVTLAWCTPSEDNFFFVPIASWVMFGLIGVALALDGLAFFLWRQFVRQHKKLAQTTNDLQVARKKLAEADRHLPAVYGHAALNRPEFPVLIQTFFKDFPGVKYIRVTPLPGGYGGSTTVLASLQTQHDLLPLSFVLKLGQKDRLADECAKFDRYVDARLPNVPPFHTERYTEWGEFAGIAYKFAGLGGEIRNFHQFYQGSATLEVSEFVGEIFSPLSQAWYRRGRPVAVNLYREYNLLSKKQADINRHLFKIVDKNDPYRVNLEARAELSGLNIKPGFCQNSGIPWSDPMTFLQRWSTRSLNIPVHRSIVHGDLHARNVLVETKRGGVKQVWFIDFSHAGNGLSQTRSAEADREGTLTDPHKGHTLWDFCRLEADIKFILTKLDDETNLALAVAFEKELLTCGLAMPDLQLSPPRIEALTDERFKKAWQVIREIRCRAAGYLVNKTDLKPYYLNLLRTTLPIVYYHSDQFENELCERQQKRYAFISAGMLCSQLESPIP